MSSNMGSALGDIEKGRKHVAQYEPGIAAGFGFLGSGLRHFRLIAEVWLFRTNNHVNWMLLNWWPLLNWWHSAHAFLLEKNSFFFHRNIQYLLTHHPTTTATTSEYNERKVLLNIYHIQDHLYVIWPKFTFNLTGTINTMRAVMVY